MLPVIPPDSVALQYQSLCEVQLLHRYFLNVGDRNFDQNPNDATVLAVRRDYDLRQFWRLEPSPDTRELLRRYQLLLRPTAEGLRVAGRLPVTTPGSPAVLALTFWAYPTDPLWMVYTQLPLEPDPDFPTDPTKARDKLDLLALLDPKKAPAGRVLVLTAPTTPADAASHAAEQMALTLEPWPASERGPRPVAVLRVPLQEGLSERVFSYMLGNRSTHWEYKTRPSSPATRPLVRHGRVEVSFVNSDSTLDPAPNAPNPTPATTTVAAGVYTSHIY